MINVKKNKRTISTSKDKREGKSRHFETLDSALTYLYNQHDLEKRHPFISIGYNPKGGYDLKYTGDVKEE